ncbi:uncharacterized protein EDB93DRAFT_1255920 [Suillus bovinus]|uniref:uncharacterized protein n=1 Tax=Suillus bovinus TaxID=48563 RepID=UPI001B8857FD|nr:uncharacterized protein EDB93DRAFT_1255920 [Suillus bovinus]KAG2130434.1 hypothetical protein EDB93DRAFT_1255920 [Suillus bovinus]
MENEDDQPTGTIVIRQPTRMGASLPAVPTKSKDATKEVKQVEVRTKIGRVQPKTKGKGKEKVEKITKPEQAKKPISITTRAAMHQFQPTLILVSEDAMDDTDQVVQGNDDTDMPDVTDLQQETDIATKMVIEPEVKDQHTAGQSGAIALVDDFPADHWQKETNVIPLPIYPAMPATDRPSSTPAPSNTHEHVLALAAQVTAMEMANRNAVARVNAMEQDFNSRISSMRLKLLVMQLNHGREASAEVIPNPLFQPPTMSYGNSSSATVFGMRYLNSIFGPLVPPIPQSANIGQQSAYGPSACLDIQGTTFTSGQASSASKLAGPSSTPAAVGPHCPATSPVSTMRPLP